MDVVLAVLSLGFDKLVDNRTSFSSQCGEVFLRKFLKMNSLDLIDEGIREMTLDGS